MNQNTSFLIHCNGIKLARKDGLFGKSDPFVIIKASNGRSIGFSNVVMKNLNPFWSPISIDSQSCGGMNSHVSIEVYDFDNDGDHDLIGITSCTLHELVTQLNAQRVLFNPNMKKKKAQGTFVVTKVDVDNKPKPKAYAIHFVAKSLANKDSIIGKSDPFLMIYTNGSIIGESEEKKIFVAKSEYIMNDLNPVWKPLEISVHACGGLDQALQIYVYDYDDDGAHDIIGYCRTTLRQLVTSKPTLLLLDDKKKGKIGYRNSGMLSVGTVQDAMPKYDDNLVRINVQFRAKKLTNKDTFGKSDPYLKVKKDDNFTVFQTPHVKNDLNPVWAPFDLLVNDCGGLSRVLTFEVWDHDKGSDDFIGHCKISLRHLLFWERNPVWRIKNPKKFGKGNAGKLEVISLTPFAAGVSNVAVSHQREAMQTHMASMAPNHSNMPPQSGYYPSQAHPPQNMYPPNPGYVSNAPVQSGYAPRQDYPQPVTQNMNNSPITSPYSQNQSMNPNSNQPINPNQSMYPNMNQNPNQNMNQNPNQPTNPNQSMYPNMNQNPNTNAQYSQPPNQNAPVSSPYPIPGQNNNANVPAYARY